MSEAFDPQHHLVLVRAVLFGPRRSTVLRLALDTGATSTMINRGPLTWVGYDPSMAAANVRIITGSRIEHVPWVRIESLEVLGRREADFQVLAHTLPPGAGVDGLLGLDFLRGRVLSLDFRRGLLSLT